MSKAQINWLITAVVLLLIFCFLLPVGLYFSYPIGISIVLAILVGLCVLFLATNVKEYYDIFSIDNKLTENFSVVILTGVTVITATFIIYWVNDYRVDRNLIQNGIFTQAKIVDGMEITREGRRTKINYYNMDFMFFDTITKREYKIRADIDSKMFDKIYIDQNFEVVYLKSNPYVYRLLLENNEIKKFKNIENRKLELDDYLELVGETDPEVISNKINKISIGWNTKKTDEDIIFANTLTNDYFALKKDNELFIQLDNYLEIDKRKEEGTLVPFQHLENVYILNNVICEVLNPPNFSNAFEKHVYEQSKKYIILVKPNNINQLEYEVGE